MPIWGPVVCDPAGGGDIDPQIFTDQTDDRSYLIWKVDGNSISQSPSLWSAPLNASLAVDGAALELLTDDQPWQAGVIEGPNMIETDGSYYLFYSANSYETSQYGIGFATCSSPLGPCTDSSDNPVMVGAEGMSGPGGVSPFTGSTGLDMAFSAWAGTVGYNNRGHRGMYTATVSFESGVPRFDP